MAEVLIFTGATSDKISV